MSFILVHCAVTLHTVSLDTDSVFENKAPPLLQTNSPKVLYCADPAAGITEIISLAIVGQSEIRQKHKVTLISQNMKEITIAALLQSKDLENFKIVVVTHIYPPVTGQRQTLKIGPSTHFLLQ